MHSLVAQDSDQTIDLQFAWPDGLTLSVDRAFTRKTDIGPMKESISSECKFLWSLEKFGDENRILFSGFAEIAPEPAPKSKDPLIQLEYISRKIEPILPTIVVDSNAQPLRLDRLDEVKSHVEKEIRALGGLNDDMFKQFANILLNEQAFQVRALEDWNRMVQVWSGNEGAEIDGSFQTTEVTGHAAGEPIENLFIYSIEEGTKPETVILTVVQKPKKEQLKLVLDSMLGGDAHKVLQLPEDAELAFENRFTTVCDPSTLIPLSYKKTKLWGAYVGKDRDFQGRVDTWSYSFSVVTNKPNK